MAEPLFEAAALEGEPAAFAPRNDGAVRIEAPHRRDDADDLPGWLRDALARRGLRPHDRWPPVHHLLTERDLPSEPDEDEAVSVSTLHDQLAYELRPGLTFRYKGREDMLLAHDLYVYFDDIQQGPPRRATARRMSPDVLVSFGVSGRHRRSYTVWEEGKPPDFALEIVSDFTWQKDVRTNPLLYERMGVREYFLFDPNENVKPRLQGWQFRGDEPLRSPAVEVAGGMVGIYSHVLGLHLCHTDPWRVDAKGTIKLGRLRWHDPATGEFLETTSEVAQRAEETKRRVAETERLVAESAQRVEEATQRANAEADARRALEARVAALEAQLRSQ